jgi:formylglycine-generating enzyme required for sulfatase activity/serine/threonine protein kinase
MTSQDADPLALIGSTVADKYAIERLAGDGGFSVVYRAQHLIWRQPVAIKFFNVLRDARPETRERLLEEFIQEGRLMSELSSRSAAIVQARDIGKIEIDGAWIPYMVLEWLDGLPLDQVVRDEVSRGMPCRDLAEALTLLEPVAVALDVAHTQGIAHRDLKPANIMVLGDPRESGVQVKVLDFGIAKVMADQEELQQQLKQTGQQLTAFTPNYGAPEQFSRKFGATGPWTDVYAMALILVEMLIGSRALTATGMYELGIQSCDASRRPTPRTLGVQVPDEIEAIFMRALAVLPAERYPSMQTMWTELHQVVFGSPWRPTTAINPNIPRGQFTGPAANMPTAAGVTETISPPTTGGHVVPALAAAGVVLIGAVGGYFLFGSDASDTGASRTTSSASAAELASPPTRATAGDTGINWDGPCPRGMKLVTGGNFTMGSNEKGFKLWKPAHEVTLDSYCLGVNEVTVADYGRCVKAGDCKPADEKPNFPKNKGTSDELHQKQLSAFAELCNEGKPKRDDHPVNCVDWYRAANYCKKQNFRLPSEAEWELAARGGDARRFPWGDDPGGFSYMNAAGQEWADWLAANELPEPSGLMYDKNDGFVGTSPVGRYPRAQTQGGHLDMIGNVWEWTNDWFEIYKDKAQVNPKGASAGDRKAIRGGGFNGEFSLWVNPAARYHQLATASVHAIGFRCASALKPQE